MYKKVLRIIGIAAGIFALIMASVVFWVYRNQEKLIHQITEAVSGSLNGELEIGEFHFTPLGRHFGLTFNLSDISLRDSLYQENRQPVLSLKKLNVTFGWQSLLLFNVNVKNIHFQQGKVFLYHRRDGYTNLSVFGKKEPEQKSTSSSPLSKIKSISLDEVDFIYADSLKEKFYEAQLFRFTGNLKTFPEGWEIAMRGPVHVTQLMFNSAKGAFLKNKDIHLSGSIRFNKLHQELAIVPGTAIQLAGGEQINLSGSIGTGGMGKPIALQFQTNRIRVPLASSLLADTITAKIDRLGIDTYASAQVQVNGETGQKKAAVKVAFKTDTFTYITPYGMFKELKTEGVFNNQLDPLLPPSPENSYVKTGTIKGYFEKVPIKGSLSLNNLSIPVAEVILHASADSASINSLFDTHRYQATNGFVNVDLKYSGKIKNIYDAETDQLNGKLYGRIAIVGLEVGYLPRNIKLSKIESIVSFTENEILIHRLALSDRQNRMFIHGRMKRPFHTMLGSTQPAYATLDIDIPKWQFNWIEILVSSTQNSAKKNSSPKLSQLMDQLMENLTIDANLKAGQLTYFNFKAQNVVGKVTFTDHITDVKELSLQAFGGRVHFKGKLTSPNPKHQLASLQANGKITRADVSSILYSFNDFGQKALSSKNVKGTLDVDFRFSSQVNPDVSLVPNSMAGQLNLNFTNGQLLNFEPFLKIKKIIFKNRPLENVKIAPIKKSFQLKGQEVVIPKMQIESNVVTLFLEGQYSFGNNTDLSIQFPLRNLKRRDEDYEFQKYDSEELKSIFLRAVDEDGEVNIKLDSRRKARNRVYTDSTELPKDSTQAQ